MSWWQPFVLKPSFKTFSQTEFGRSNCNTRQRKHLTEESQEPQGWALPLQDRDSGSPVSTGLFGADGFGSAHRCQQPPRALAQARGRERARRASWVRERARLASGLVGFGVGLELPEPEDRAVRHVLLGAAGRGDRPRRSLGATYKVFA